jgi:hypothetical protein
MAAQSCLHLRSLLSGALPKCRTHFLTIAMGFVVDVVVDEHAAQRNGYRRTDSEADEECECHSKEWREFLQT